VGTEAKAEDALQSEGNHGSEGEDTLKNEVGQDSSQANGLKEQKCMCNRRQYLKILN
jgi:hypothetical protein